MTSRAEVATQIEAAFIAAGARVRKAIELEDSAACQRAWDDLAIQAGAITEKAISKEAPSTSISADLVRHRAILEKVQSLLKKE